MVMSDAANPAGAGVVVGASPVVTALATLGDLILQVLPGERRLTGVREVQSRADVMDGRPRQQCPARQRTLGERGGLLSRPAREQRIMRELLEHEPVGGFGPGTPALTPALHPGGPVGSVGD
jgi:hypothetical protein